jgi:UDP-N-acetyl-D-glucosamine dehydrogenase
LNDEGYRLITAPKRDVAIVGLDRTGLPLLLHFVRHGLRVLGIDFDATHIAQLKRGQGQLAGFPFAELKGFIDSQSLRVSIESEEVAYCRAVLVTAPTQLNPHREPDLTVLEKTLELIGPYLTPQALVVIESMLYPGALEERLIPVLERFSGKTAGRDFHLAYAPSREAFDPHTFKVSESVRFIAGLTPACRDRGVSLYQGVSKTIRPVSSLRIAELAFLGEDLARQTQRALAGEMQELCSSQGLNMGELRTVLDWPSPNPVRGLGESPLAPAYFLWQARAAGQTPRTVTAADEFASRLPARLGEAIATTMNQRGLPLHHSRILMVGLARVPNTDDDRDSVAYALIQLLRSKQAHVSYYDPHLPYVPVVPENRAYRDLRSVEWSEENLSSHHAIVFLTAHTAVDYLLLSKTPACLIDATDSLSDRLPVEMRARVVTV